MRWSNRLPRDVKREEGKQLYFIFTLHTWGALADSFANRYRHKSFTYQQLQVLNQLNDTTVDNNDFFDKKKVLVI